MSPTLVTLLTFVAAALMAACAGSLAYDYFFRYRAVVRERLNQICAPEVAHEFSLFKDVERRIALQERGTNEELRRRLESVALQVIEHQLTALSDVGMVERGDALPEKIKDYLRKEFDLRRKAR